MQFLWRSKNTIGWTFAHCDLLTMMTLRLRFPASAWLFLLANHMKSWCCRTDISIIRISIENGALPGEISQEKANHSNRVLSPSHITSKNMFGLAFCWVEECVFFLAQSRRFTCPPWWAPTKAHPRPPAYLLCMPWLRSASGPWRYSDGTCWDCCRIFSAMFLSVRQTTGTTEKLRVPGKHRPINSDDWVLPRCWWLSVEFNCNLDKRRRFFVVVQSRKVQILRSSLFAVWVLAARRSVWVFLLCFVCLCACFSYTRKCEREKERNLSGFVERVEDEVEWELNYGK